MAASPTMRPSSASNRSSPKSPFLHPSNTHLSPPLPFGSSPSRRPSASHQHPFHLSSRSSSSSSSSSSSTATSSPASNSSSPKLPDRFKSPRSQSPKATQFIMLHNDERPPSPLTLTSTLAPPSLIPVSAAGISVKPLSKMPSRNSPAAHLKLSMLPSATYPQATPHASGVSSNFSLHEYPRSTQSYAHSLSAQQQLQLHQKEIISQATRAAGIPAHLLSTGPRSPRLIPLGSPGPVTPLTLEENSGGYLFAGSGGDGFMMEQQQQLQQQLAIVAAGQGEIRRGY